MNIKQGMLLPIIGNGEVLVKYNGNGKVNLTIAIEGDIHEIIISKQAIDELLSDTNFSVHRFDSSHPMNCIIHWPWKNQLWLTVSTKDDCLIRVISCKEFREIVYA